MPQKPTYEDLAQKVAELEKEQKTYRENVEKYQVLIENSTDLIYVIDTNGYIKYMNKTIERYGIPAKMMLNQNFRDFVHQDFHERVDKIMKDLLKISGQIFKLENIRITNGVDFFNTDVICCYLPDTPNIEGIIINCRDITKRIRAEKVLRKSKERLKLITENMSDLVGMFDTNLNVTFVGPSHETVLGYPISHFLGKSALDFIHKDDIPEVLDKAIASTEKNEDTIVEYRTRHANSHYLWFEANIRILFDADEKMIGGIFNSRNITERKLAEENLIKAKDTAEKANKAKDTFLATMSHELRTPLNGVLGITKLLLLSDMDDQQRKHLESIFHSGNALLKVLNSVLDLARIEANKFELEYFDFELKKTVEQVVQLFSGSAEIKGVDLMYEIKDDVPAILKSDHNRIGQVLSNLVANALKFTEKGSIVLIVSTLEKTGNKITLRFEISDTGIGISQDKLTNIFQSFTQVDSSTTRKYGGTGLGLTIARKIVDLMDGKIGVESKLGRGSVFWFEIPLVVSSSSMDKIQDSTENQQDTPIIPKAEYNILIVEDDLVSQLVITGMLKQLGYKTNVVTNGLDALDRITRTSYDLVFMDCLMPEIDGFETTRLIRDYEKSLEPPKQIPIIALTAKAMRGDREQCLAAGMNDYLTKPLFLNNLQRVLHRFLS